jgi:P-type Mg2+ transporter
VAGNPLKSRPSRSLFLAVFAIVAVAVLLPYTGLGKLLQFTPLPLSLLATIALLAVTYLLLVQGEFPARLREG